MRLLNLLPQLCHINWKKDSACSLFPFVMQHIIWNVKCDAHLYIWPVESEVICFTKPRMRPMWQEVYFSVFSVLTNQIHFSVWPNTIMPPLSLTKHQWSPERGAVSRWSSYGWHCLFFIKDVRGFLLCGKICVHLLLQEKVFSIFIYFSSFRFSGFSENSSTWWTSDLNMCFTQRAPEWRSPLVQAESRGYPKVNYDIV